MLVVPHGSGEHPTSTQLQFLNGRLIDCDRFRG